MCRCLEYLILTPVSCQSSPSMACSDWQLPGHVIWVWGYLSSFRESLPFWDMPSNRKMGLNCHAVGKWSPHGNQNQANPAATHVKAINLSAALWAFWQITGRTFDVLWVNAGKMWKCKSQMQLYLPCNPIPRELLLSSEGQLGDDLISPDENKSLPART